MLSLLLILLFLELPAPKSTGDSVIVGLLKEAGVVLEANSHVRTEARYLKVMNAGLTHDLLDENMLKVFTLNGVTFFVDLVLEDVKSETTSLRKSLFYEELVLAISVRKVDDFLSLIVYMRLVVVILFDRLLARNQLADVHSRGV